MLYREHPAPPDLAAFVRCFWTLTGDLPAGSDERVLPDGRQEFIVHLSDPFTQGDAIQPRALFTGQISGPLLLRPTGTVSMFGICFHPGGAWPFLRWPQSESAGKILPLEDVWDSSFAPRIRACASNQQRCETAAHLLRSRLRPDPASPRLAAAIHQMQLKPWNRIDAAASAACLSPRHFERLFLQRVGLPPKTFASILRFQHVLHLRDAQPHWTWARVAQESGYYDQAHLIADFRRFSGSTPAWHESDWTALERAFVRT